MNTQRAIVVAILVLTSGAMVPPLGRVTAQQARPSGDMLPELLSEVKGLRAAMEQMASAGPRIQLFTARLQLQETRINNIFRRLDTVRDRMDEARRDIARLEGDERQLAAAIAEQKPGSSPEAREEASMATLLMAGVKTKMSAAKAVLDRHGAEEAQLLTDLTAEQARWTDINRRLDELEQALVRAAGR